MCSGNLGPRGHGINGASELSGRIGRIRCTGNGRHDRHSMGSGTDHITRSRRGDTGYADDGYGNGIGYFQDSFQTPHGEGIALGTGRVDGTKPDVVRSSLFGRPGQSHGRSRNPDDAIGSHDAPCLFKRHVRLAEVHSGSADSQGNIDTVIDEQGDPVPLTDPGNFCGIGQDISNGTVLLAELDGVGATKNGSLGQFSMRQTLLKRVVRQDMQPSDGWSLMCGGHVARGFPVQYVDSPWKDNSQTFQPHGF